VLSPVREHARGLTDRPIPSAVVLLQPDDSALCLRCTAVAVRSARNAGFLAWHSRCTL
jgi:hypothetical protein